MTASSQSRKVEGFQPYPPNSYSDLDLAGLAAFAIMRLHDLHIPNTFENLVVTLFKMFPTKFSLVGFDVYPDAARVGRTLLQLGPKYRNWARGSVNKGFVLTEAGKTKALSVSEVLSGLTPSSPKRVIGRTAPRTKDLSKDLQVLRDSPLYQQWKVGALSTTNSIELFNLLGAYAYTPPRVLRERIKMLESIAVELEQQEISEFLRAVRHNFSEELQD